MNALINLVSSGILAPVWGFLDGKKTALAAGASMLTGAGALAAEIVPLAAAHNTAGLLELVKHLPSDPAYLLIVGGLCALGIGHKIDKAADAAEAPATDAPAAK